MKKINSTEQRLGGFCPLTPKEVGIFLQALGYAPSSVIYIAAGEIYGGNMHLSELTSLFPNVVFKVLSFCFSLILMLFHLFVLAIKFDVATLPFCVAMNWVSD